MGDGVHLGKMIVARLYRRRFHVDQIGKRIFGSLRSRPLARTTTPPRSWPRPPPREKRRPSPARRRPSMASSTGAPISWPGPASSPRSERTPTTASGSSPRPPTGSRNGTATRPRSRPTPARAERGRNNPSNGLRRPPRDPPPVVISDPRWERAALDRFPAGSLSRPGPAANVTQGAAFRGFQRPFWRLGHFRRPRGSFFATGYNRLQQEFVA